MDNLVAVYLTREVGRSQPLVTEAEGLRLHMSSKTATGYMGVFPTDSGRFKAEARLSNLGTFDSAVEAAAAVARRLQEKARLAAASVVEETEGPRPPAATPTAYSEGTIKVGLDGESRWLASVAKVPS